MMIIIKYLLMIYCTVYMSSGLHEIGHCVGAFIINAKINKVVLGNEKMALKIKKLYISPVLKNFYVEVDLSDKDKCKGLIYYASGAAVNFFIILTALYIKNNLFTSLFVVLFNTVSVVKSMSPFIKESDISKWNEIYKKAM